MDPMFVPPDRKKPKPFRLALLLGMTVLLFFVIANHYGQITQMVMPTQG